MLLRRGVAASVAEAANAGDRDDCDSARLLRAPALGSGAGIRYAWCGRSVSRSARQSAGMARSAYLSGEPPLSSWFLRSGGPVEFAARGCLAAYRRADRH